MQQQQGLKAAQDLRTGDNATHTSPQTFNALLDSLNQVVEEQTAREARLSPFVGIGLDESTDRSKEKHVVFVIRYIQPATARLVTTFLKCEKVADGKAITMYEAMKDVISAKEIPLKKVRIILNLYLHFS